MRWGFTGVMAILIGCGGSTTDGGRSGSSAGGPSSGGSTPGAGAAANGGTSGAAGGGAIGGEGVSGGNTGGGANGGASGASGGSSGGTTGQDPAEMSLDEAVESCRDACDLTAESGCAKAEQNSRDCREHGCDKLAEIDCFAALGAAYRCIADAGSITCNQDGEVVIHCGQCDAELEFLATTCPDLEIRCTF